MVLKNTTKLPDGFLSNGVINRQLILTILLTNQCPAIMSNPLLLIMFVTVHSLLQPTKKSMLADVNELDEN